MTGGDTHHYTTKDSAIDSLKINGFYQNIAPNSDRWSTFQLENGKKIPRTFFFKENFHETETIACFSVSNNNSSAYSVNIESELKSKNMLKIVKKKKLKNLQLW